MPETPQHEPPHQDSHVQDNSSAGSTTPLKEELDKFIAEILANREAIYQGKGNYAPVPEEDEEYRLLRQKGLQEATRNYDISHYPFYVPPQERENQEKQQREEQPTIDWKKIEQKVYLKAFLEPDEDELEEQIRAVSGRKLSYEQTRRIILERIAKSKSDFEQFIYEDIFSKVAALIFSLGVAMLIRYGISEGILPEWARVSIGVLVAGILFVIAKRLEYRNQTFSLLFATSAFCILYYTNYLAFKTYGFLSQPAAFLLMLSIVGLALWLSLHYNRLYFAVLALLGAYLTPFAIAGEKVNYDYFFAYLWLISATTIAIAYFKNWILLNYLTFITTIALFSGWMWRMNLASLAALQTGLFFSTIFYLTYFIMHLLHSLRPLKSPTEVPMSERDLFFFNANAIFFAFVVYRLLSAHFLVQEYFGWWLMALGLLNGAFGGWLYYKAHADYHIRKYMQLIFLVSANLAIIFLCQTRNALHLAWLSECFLLMLIGRYWKASIFRDVFVIVLAASFIALLTIWYATYVIRSNQPFLFNDAVFATSATIVAYVACLILVRQQAQHTREKLMFITYDANTLQVLLAASSVALFYLSGNIELTYHRFSHPSLERLVIGIYNTVFAILLWIAVLQIKNKRFQFIANYVLMAAVISYIVFAHSHTVQLRNEFLSGISKPFWFFTHYINLTLDLLAIYLILSYEYGIFNPAAEEDQQNDQEENASPLRINYLVWLACSALVFHLTAELDHLYIIFNYVPGTSVQESVSNSLKQTRVFFYPILWSLIAFAWMLLGIRWRIKDLRIIASILLGVMLIKLLAYDIWYLSRFAQILLLLIIGALLLLVSYLNTQLRRLLIEGTINIEEIYRKLTGKSTDNSPPPLQQ
ncbi:MAG: DUF2339 domain-containing protein [Cytophagales bacterium]|nr:DUF2339 domain-containing protein [Bernardetiaceae bacterium]MDW8211218.1 DUF2339 domain-containing protein [Cytophagales bacterium]